MNWSRVFEFAILAIVYFKDSTATILPEFYENVKIDTPVISSFTLPTIQSCIHRCQLHQQCNVVNARQTADSKFECILTRVECFHRFEELLSDVFGWYLYKIPVKHCKAIKRKKEEKATVNNQQQVPLHLPHQCKDQAFKLVYTDGRCLRYRDEKNALVLSSSCEDRFCLTATQYLFNIRHEKCLERIQDTQIGLASSCRESVTYFDPESRKLWQSEACLNPMDGNENANLYAAKDCLLANNVFSKDFS